MPFEVARSNISVSVSTAQGTGNAVGCGNLYFEFPKKSAISNVPYVYVARGDGSSHFSEKLDEHNRAVNKYQRGGQ